ncbi:MAG: 3-hydroxyacyl-CoA dehydrogenase family protein [Firmicutes bacterium]|nr:3-hydroxyacyl-CoA dehydrogenase family protein [Bacillota bacterium]
MELNTRLQNLTVVGAAGKMGSGISLLLALDMAYRALENKDRTYVLNLVDISDTALQGLLRYLRDQAIKDAERQTTRLRQLYADREDLVENGEMIQAFADEVLTHVRTGKTLALAQDSTLVFEAAFEKEELKIGLYKELAALCPKEMYLLTNTSSIPLQALAEASGLKGRVIGYHFYNPPAVQKLLEIITPADCEPELREAAVAIAKNLRKTVVPSNDIAGFIGNGHFMRDGLHGLKEVERLAKEHGYVKAVALVNRVSRDWLLRPMGIFQLIDYVGVDVFQLILRVMEKYLKDGLHSPVIDRYIEMGVKGGQTSSGAQKDGILQYEKGQPVGVFDPDTKSYVKIDEAWTKESDALLGAHPDPSMTWKGLQKDSEREAKLRAYFAGFKNPSTLGMQLAADYLRASKAVGQRLVADGVAHRDEDVNQVLMLGFFHLYGPINSYLD